MPMWLLMLGQALLVAAVSFVVLAAVVSHLRFQRITRPVSQSPAVGTDARSAFELRVARQLGTGHRNPPPFTIAHIAPATWAHLRTLHGSDVLNELMAQMVVRLASSARRGDVVLRVQEDEIGLLIDAGRPAALAALTRLVRDLAASPIQLGSGLSIRVDALGGVASYPEDGDRAPALAAAAASALRRAREAGRGLHTAEATSAVAASPSAGQPTAAVESAETAAMLDELTGVLREDRLGTALQKLVAGQRREERPVSVLVLDVDSLRRYNQQYGREMGDSLLRGVAQFLKKNTRESDLIARAGDDQFVLALDCAAAEAFSTAQRVLSEMRKTSFGRTGLRLTATIGVAGWSAHSRHARGLLEEAQLALRVGKSKGRNQCMLFDPEMRRLKVASAPSEAF